MASILKILNEIAETSSTNAKQALLKKYSTVPFLKEVLYLSCSRRVKFYIKQIPEYERRTFGKPVELNVALAGLEKLSNRTLTGNAASKYLADLLSNLSKEDSIVVERVIQKNPKIGVRGTIINKVFPNLIEKTPYMGAIPYNKEAVEVLIAKEKELFSQIKMDGRYANVIVRDKTPELESRDGEITYLPEDCTLMQELSKLSDCVLNGELTIPGIPRYLSNGIIASIISIEEKHRNDIDVASELEDFLKKHGENFFEMADKIVFTAWDLITVPQYFQKKADVFYEARLQFLKDMINHVDFEAVRLIRYRKITTSQQALDHFYEMLEKGEEGTIVKSKKGFWVNSKPKYQIKIKLEMNVDLQIIGFNPGTGKNSKVISAIVTKSADGKVITTVAGLKESDMEYVTKNQSKLLGTILEVKSCGLSKDKEGNFALLHPRFVKLRDDKTKANTYKEIVAIENSIKGVVDNIIKP